MSFEKDEILILEDNREFIVVETLEVDNTCFLYLKSLDVDKYTIVKIIEDTIYNLTNNEISTVIANLFRLRWSY